MGDVKKIVDGVVVYKEPLYCGDCNTESGSENGECWDEFDGCHQFNQDFDDFGYAYIYPYKEGHSYMRENYDSGAVGRAAGLWGAALVGLVSLACSAGMWA